MPETMPPNSSPEKSHPEAKKPQLTPEAVKKLWDRFNDTEKGFITTKDDGEFNSLIKDLSPDTAKSWTLFRKIIKTGSPMASLIIAEINSQGRENSKENPLIKIGFIKSEDGSFLYTRLPGRYFYDKGLAAAQSKFKTDVKYPSEEQAMALLNKFKAEFPDNAIAAFIDEENTFAYLTKTGKPGKFKSERVPGDTELFVFVVAS
ncbi:MAG: hypothetical protein Q8R29_02160 [bacterium]|nr:hypothetical protein [bacterium]